MGISHYILVILVLISFYTVTFALSRPRSEENNNFREKEILDQILNYRNYDARIRPALINGTDGPIFILVSTLVQSISKINDFNMEYNVELTFHQEWKDERLKFNDSEGQTKYLTLTNPHNLWLPDLFFASEKRGHLHNLLTPNNYIKIFPNGVIVYLQRISLTLSCPMNFKYYPLDRQVCSMRIASYAYTTEKIILLWKPVPVQVVENLEILQFSLEKFKSDYCNISTSIGEFSCIKIDFWFKRNFFYYFTHMYLPCFMLVLVSWISFWINPKAVTARILLGITTFLSLAMEISSLNREIPSVSYIKYIDIWFGVCLSFTFVALLEYVIVYYISDSVASIENQGDEMKNRKQTDQDASSDFLECDGAQILHQKRKNRFKTWPSKFLTKSKKIDVISRIFFPIGFLLFNLAYWSTYLISEE